MYMMPEPVYDPISMKEAVEILWAVAYVESKQEYLEKLQQKGIYICRRRNVNFG